MNKTEKKVIAAGTLVLDVIPQFPKTTAGERLTTGGTVYVDDMRCSLGGSVGNTGIALWKLGADTELFSKVGNDSFGGMVTESLNELGIPKTVSVDTERRTSSSVIVSPPGADRLILHCRGASQHYTEADFSEPLLAGRSLFHFGYPTGMACMYADGGETLSGIFRRVKKSQLTTSMDMSFPGVATPAGKADWKAILKKTLPYVDVFLPSLEEITLMLSRERYCRVLEAKGNVGVNELFDMGLLRELSDELLEMGVEIAGIKCGAKGFYLRTAKTEALSQCGRLTPAISSQWSNRELFAAPYTLEQMRSTNGAGDTSIAGFLIGLLMDKSPEYSLQMASAAAANRICSGSAASLVDYQELERKIEAGWSKENVVIEDTHWKYDEQQDVFVRV